MEYVWGVVVVDEMERYSEVRESGGIYTFPVTSLSLSLSLCLMSILDLTFWFVSSRFSSLLLVVMLSVVCSNCGLIRHTPSSSSPIKDVMLDQQFARCIETKS